MRPSSDSGGLKILIILYSLQGLHPEDRKALPHDLEGGLAHQNPAGFFLAPDHFALAVKVSELRRQAVEVVAKSVGSEILHGALDGLWELADGAQKRPLRLASDSDLAGVPRVRSRIRDSGLGEDRANPCMGVLKVDGRVPLEIEHPIKGELVVGRLVLFQVGVLDGRVSHLLGDLLELLLVLRKLVLPLNELLLAPAHRLVQQVR
mmetsp:Transcript_10092/g.28599  ORF Transcript_10092/g.28599 Transcript_10092/m.28599 type:complete len:206 (-) Transcript_10092:1673-2290(-)